MCHWLRHITLSSNALPPQKKTNPRKEVYMYRMWPCVEVQDMFINNSCILHMNVNMSQRAP